MPHPKKYHAVPGSNRTAPTGSTIVGEVDPNARLTITVRIRRPAASETLQAQTLKQSKLVPRNREYLTREQFAALHGADPTDLAKVGAFAHENGLTIVESSRAKRSVKLSGTIRALTTAFQTKVHQYSKSNRRYRGRVGTISVPEELSAIVVGVHGFDNQPVARPHNRRRPKRSDKSKATGPKQTQALGSSYTPLQVAELYGFPTGLNGTGQCIGVIELNDIDTTTNAVNGAGFSATDLQTFFSGLNLPVPQVVTISADGGANTPGPDPNADAEVTLDIEVAGAIAPGAKIAVYFTPNTTQGFIDAVTQAVHDTDNAPSVLSISWGGPEDSQPQQFLDGLAEALLDAATLGVTVCCAAGDNGSADTPTNDPSTPWDGKPHVDFPSSNPYALACGGTKLTGSGTTIASEVVWNDGTQGGAGGGGVSNLFARPDYQASLTIPTSPTGNVGRGLPDVSGDADPETGYEIFLAGNQEVVGGTSAVAPLWAGLIARINQRLVSIGSNSVGFLNPVIYGSSIANGGAFNDIVSGTNDITGTLNGLYTAGPGWDPASGLGSPDGAKLLSALGG
jgi:kumamolisin